MVGVDVLGEMCPVHDVSCFEPGIEFAFVKGQAGDSVEALAAALTQDT